MDDGPTATGPGNTGPAPALVPGAARLSLYDYRLSADIAGRGLPFYALIAAAMRQADGPNEERLRHAWPNVWADLDARYNAPGGHLPSDQPEGGPGA